ncbi:hypothetical protein EBESD8_39880 [Rhodococcus aetherivorans]|nr:hypothetical protein EBESD8_39880 [Rhodococcus aetherivorans]
MIGAADLQIYRGERHARPLGPVLLGVEPAASRAVEDLQRIGRRRTRRGGGAACGKRKTAAMPNTTSAQKPTRIRDMTIQPIVAAPHITTAPFPHGVDPSLVRSPGVAGARSMKVL